MRSSPYQALGDDDNDTARPSSSSSSLSRGTVPRPSNQVELSSVELKDEAAGDVSERHCRFCFEGEEEGPLMFPCSHGCGYAHFECLKRWMEVKQQHECEVCRQTYRGVKMAKKCNGLSFKGRFGDQRHFRVTSISYLVVVVLLFGVDSTLLWLAMRMSSWVRILLLSIAGLAFLTTIVLFVVVCKRVVKTSISYHVKIEQLLEPGDGQGGTCSSSGGGDGSSSSSSSSSNQGESDETVRLTIDVPADGSPPV